MIKLFFITILVITTNDNPKGWLQWSKSYSDKSACEEVIKKTQADILLSVQHYLGKKFIAVKKMECLTYNEAVERNDKLGH